MARAAAATASAQQPLSPRVDESNNPLSPTALLNGSNSNSNKSLPPIPSIETASTLNEIHASLEHLTRRESALNDHLDSLVASKDDLLRELSRLDLIRARLGTQVVAARGISSGMLSSASSTASRISSAVRALDIEQERVRETLNVVESVVELKACVLGVTGSMGAPQDWEAAARFLDRASKIPSEIIKGSFAEEMVPTSEVPDSPHVTLSNASESLCGLFLREFEKATKSGDGEKITRFFKLFPLIGRADTGLEVYGRFVCGGIATKARANLGRKSEGGMFYAGLMSQLFEYIAGIVEQHSPIVERHYGKGRMVKVIEKLQLEADTQGGIIIDTFWDERGMARKLSDVKSYAFSFLVQSFLTQPSGGSSTPRTQSPRPGATGSSHRNSEDDGIDIKEVDQLLTELGVMLSRWSLYCRFISRKCRDPSLDNNETATAATMAVPPVISNSNLIAKVDSRLSSSFEIMTTFFFRRSVEKAFQLDEPPPGLKLHPPPGARVLSNPPYITSAVDDVMYIVNKLLRRTLSAAHRGLSLKTVASCRRVLESDFVGMIQRKMRDESYPKSNILNAPPPDDKVVSFCVLMNNLDVASDYISRIIEGLVSPSTADGIGGESEPLGELVDLFPFADDAESVRDSLKGMSTSFTARAGELTNDGINVLFAQVVKPKARLLITESFRDADYLVTESVNVEDGNTGGGSSAGADADEDDDRMIASYGVDVAAKFTVAYQRLMHPLRRIMTAGNYERLQTTLATYLSKLLERRIFAYSSRINELGAIRLERDVGSIVSTIVREGKYGLRDLFTRCVQVCIVLNMEEDEITELLMREATTTTGRNNMDVGDDGVEWVLSREEKQMARGLLVKDR